jgi:hypothetical protein
MGGSMKTPRVFSQILPVRFGRQPKKPTEEPGGPWHGLKICTWCPCVSVQAGLPVSASSALSARLEGFAEFKRVTIRERISAGTAASRAMGNKAARAVQPLSECEDRAGGGDLRCTGQWFGPERRGEDIQLRQIDACIAAEQPRPGTSGQHDRVADDAAFLGDNAGDASGLAIDATHSAAGQDNGPMRACRLGDGGCRL